MEDKKKNNEKEIKKIGQNAKKALEIINKYKNEKNKNEGEER